MKERWSIKCRVCGNLFYVVKSRNGKAKYCSNRCKGKGRYLGADNYEEVSIQGKRKPAHVVLAERIIGRDLSGKIVHHIDEDKRNNANSNLIVLENRAEHNKLHQKLRIVKMGGDPKNDKICSRCKMVVGRNSFYKSSATYDGLCSCCKVCASEIAKDKYRRRFK